MSQPYVAEIRMFAGNFAPNGWLFCAGQLLPIAENEVLFQLIGTTYGGDGQTNFALPDLRGRAPVHMGTGGGQTVTIGQMQGTETVALTTTQLPSHSHAAPAASNAAATSRSPGGGNAFAVESNDQTAIYSTAAPDVSLANTPQVSGGSQPHENMQPYLAMNYIISLFGVFPSQA